MADYTHIKRNFGPVYNNDSKVLILGSFPSVKSREQAFFYGHKQNRFWPLMGKLLNTEIPEDIPRRKELMLQRKIALWDVIEECDIIGSSDSSIKNVVPVDIMKIINTADIQGIFCNGNTSYTLYMKYLYPISQITAHKLPSTSPANAAWNIERLYEEWKILLELL